MGRMTVCSGFTLNDELDLLELRLSEFDPVIDEYFSSERE